MPDLVVALSACDECQSLFLGTAWCHDRMTSHVQVPVLDPAAAAEDAAVGRYVDDEFEARFETASDGGEL